MSKKRPDPPDCSLLLVVWNLLKNDADNGIPCVSEFVPAMTLKTENVFHYQCRWWLWLRLCGRTLVRRGHAHVTAASVSPPSVHSHASVPPQHIYTSSLSCRWRHGTSVHESTQINPVTSRWRSDFILRYPLKVQVQPAVMSRQLIHCSLATACFQLRQPRTTTV
jgi:hypothetical protein